VFSAILFLLALLGTCPHPTWVSNNPHGLVSAWASTTAERELGVPAGTLAELIAAQRDPDERA
ncbi:hypothetical protein ACFRJ3_00840, partial [Streptomyces sp. NPDC056696]|uniref:hypothetical protein n=1 Tax=Streptomyces sp. NPDC056696 TaxID=3345914 RepID=UPI00369EB640